MKNLFKAIVFIFVASVITTSCQKDAYTEEDAQKALQTISLVITAQDATNGDAPLDSAIVKAIINGAVVEKATNSAGAAIFEDVKIGGDINVYVSKDGYTTLTQSVSTNVRDYRQTSVTSNIRLHSLSDDVIFTIKGKLTVETNLTNRIKEVVAAGTEVRAINNNQVGTKVSYVATTDAEGNYELKIPVGGSGTDDITVYFDDYVAKQTLGLKKMNGTIEVVQRDTKFGASANVTSIKPIPSAIFSIAAPAAQGSGLAFTTEADSMSSIITSLTDYDFNILSKGSGYYPNISGPDTTVWVMFNPDVLGQDTARIQLTFKKNGGLIDFVDLDNNGIISGRLAKYSPSHPPVLDLSIGGGSGAIIDFYTRWKWIVKISNNGSGYLSIPNATYTIQMRDGTVKTKDLMLGIRASLLQGGIYGIGGATVNHLYSLVNPTFDIDASSTVTAQVSISEMKNSINSSDSTVIYNIIPGARGLGFDKTNPPTVTITALAGYGSGAVYRAVVSGGKIDFLIKVQSGTGYVKNINDYLDAGSIGVISGNSGTRVASKKYRDVMPGSTKVFNYFYGTGEPLEDL